MVWVKKMIRIFDTKNKEFKKAFRFEIILLSILILFHLWAIIIIYILHIFIHELGHYISWRGMLSISKEKVVMYYLPPNTRSIGPYPNVNFWENFVCTLSGLILELMVIIPLGIYLFENWILFLVLYIPIALFGASSDFSGIYSGIKSEKNQDVFYIFRCTYPFLCFYIIYCFKLQQIMSRGGFDQSLFLELWKNLEHQGFIDKEIDILKIISRPSKNYNILRLGIIEFITSIRLINTLSKGLKLMEDDKVIINPIQIEKN